LTNTTQVTYCVKNDNFLFHTLLYMLRDKQELSYRKQIARKLRTQYVEGIYDNPMTLKSRLRSLEVTAGNGTIG